MAWHPGSRHVAVEGRRAHVVDVGRGPPVLLLHGFLHSSYTWRASIAALAARHRVLAPDLPGFGWSDGPAADPGLPGLARFVDGLLSALGVERLHAACGSSLGAAVLLDLALRAPERVARLALVSPLAATLPVPSLPFRVLGLPLFAPLFRATAGNPTFVRRALALAAYHGPVDDDVLFGFSRLAGPGSHRAATETARTLWATSASVDARVASLRQPALVVWGRQDRVLPLAYGRRVEARLPAARFEVLDGCGHCAHEEAPSRFHPLLDGLLAAPVAGDGAAGIARAA